MMRKARSLAGKAWPLHNPCLVEDVFPGKAYSIVFLSYVQLLHGWGH